tara:strand:+ start:5917 stop:6018 length:102 start_codon:yes stop_codon:yes gene_type:complete
VQKGKENSVQVTAAFLILAFGVMYKLSTDKINE